MPPMVTPALSKDLKVFDKWALCCQLVGDEFWAGSMSGQVVALDFDLKELRRWQAHEGSVNGILADGTTYGGDGLVKDKAGDILAGPFKKPISKVQRVAGRLYVGTYERALYIDGDRQPKIAAWHALADGTLFKVRQIGSKAGDLGPIEIDDQELTGSAWSLSAGSQADTVYAYFKDGHFGELDLSGDITPLPWQDTQGPPTVVQGEGLIFLIGNHQVMAVKEGEVVATLRLKTKGLYGSSLLPDGRLAIAAADGNLKVIEIAA